MPYTGSNPARPAARRAARLASVLLVLACLAWDGPAAQGRRPMTETDLLKLTWIADPQIAPDGSQVAFVRVRVTAKEDGYETSIWLVPTDGSEPPRRLTAGPRDQSPRWSPDGRRLAFSRPAGEGAAQATQIHLLDFGGGEAVAITSIPRGAGTPVWSPDGRTIAFTSTALPSDFAPAATTSGGAAGSGDSSAEPRKSDVRVITRATYRSNGPGYLDATRHSHIWTVEVPAGSAAAAAPKQVTSGMFDEQAPAWAPDGARLYFSSNRRIEPYYEAGGASLYAVAASGGEPVRIAEVAGSLGAPTPSPDGRHLASVGSLHGNPVRSYSQPDLFVAEAAPAAGAEPRNLTTGYDFDIGGSLSGDQRAPRGSLPGGPVWSADGRTITIVSAEQGRANLVRVEVASGRVEPLTRGDHEVVSYTVTPAGTRAALLISSPSRVGDLFVLDLAEAPPATTSRAPGRTSAGASRQPAAPPPLRQITALNDALAGELAPVGIEEFWYSSFDGRKVQGWIMKPPDFDPSRKYPLILEIHGGPHAAYGWTFTHEFSWMASRGYVVLFTNPRGSTSYGQEFGNLIQHNYPGDDYKDLMAGVDELLKRGFVDAARMGVTGGSGGGVLTNWTITHTDRFKGAVSQRSIADWSNFWFTADFTLFQPTWFKAAPWEDPADFAARSAITHVAKVTTPLMLVEGESDDRTPPGAGGEVMFRALKYLKKPVVMVRFPGETHELSRSGQPWHRVERLRHILAWFDKYLLGKAVDGYDVR